MESFNGGNLIEICTCFIEENPFEKGFSVSINIFFRANTVRPYIYNT